MQRRWYSSAHARLWIVAAVTILIGCETREPDANGQVAVEWARRDQQLVEAFQRVQAKHEELEVGFATLPVADPTDTVALPQRELLRRMLDSQQIDLADVQRHLTELAERHASLRANEGEMSDAWTEARNAYEEQMMKLARVDEAYGRIGRALAAASMPGIVDTTVHE